MKKMSVFISIIIAFVIFMPNVYAEPFYYEYSEGYMLCEEFGSAKCQTISQNQSGASFDIKNGQITYNGKTYKFNSAQQEVYNNSLKGKTKMFYYVNKDNRYVLCTEENKCERYSFETLSNNGAVITNGVSVTLSDGTVYYFNSEKQNEINTSSSNNSNKNNKSTSDNNKNTTTVKNNADISQSTNCTRIKEPIMFIGNIVLIVKIAIPIILIGLGIMDLFKAVTSAKDDELKKSLRGFAMRCVAGVAIFFLPTIISVVFGMISSWADLKGEFNACQKCILNVRSCNKE